MTNPAALLIAAAIVEFGYGVDADLGVRVAAVALPVQAIVLVVVAGVYVAKRRGIAMDDAEEVPDRARRGPMAAA